MRNFGSQYHNTTGDAKKRLTISDTLVHDLQGIKKKGLFTK